MEVHHHPHVDPDNYREHSGRKYFKRIFSGIPDDISRGDAPAPIQDEQKKANDELNK